MAKGVKQDSNSVPKELGTSTLNGETRLTNNLIKTDFVARENKTRQIWLLSVLIGVPVVLLIGLLINFLVYFPNVKNSDGVKNGQFIISQNLTAFIIVIVMSVVIVAFAIFLVTSLRKQVVFDNKKKEWTLASIGLVSCFFDAIGVGSYAISIGMMKATKTLGDDKKIPGTLTVGLALPQMAEATIFVGAISVDYITLLAMVVAAIAGGLVGAWLANKINSQIFRFAIGIMMFVVGIIMILVHPHVGVIKIATNGTLGYTGLAGFKGWRLAVGIILFFILGGTSAIGLGMYAPSLAFLTLLGMGTTAIFPIMALAASAMMPPAAIKFFKDKNYMSLHSIIFSITGTIGVLISFLIFFLGLQVGAGMDQDLFNAILKWIATAVVFYCSALMLFDFSKDYKKTGWKQPEDKDVM